MTVSPDPAEVVAARLQAADDATEAVTGGIRQQRIPFSAWILRSYLDLSEVEHSPIHALGIEAASIQLFGRDEPLFPPQINPPTVLRESLLAESGLTAYAVELPEELASSLRTKRWQALVDLTANSSSLSVGRRLRLAVLMNTLGLYSATARLLGPITDEEILTQPEAALLAMKRAYARWKVEPTEQVAHESFHVHALATRTRGEGEHHVRLRAALTILILNARSRGRDALETVRSSREVAENEYRRLRPEDDWRDLLYSSSFWRAVSFLPFFEGDLEATKLELDRAEEFVRAAAQGTRLQQILYAQSLHPLLETRTKEALATGDLDLALERAQALVEVDPFDSKVHLELGDVFVRRGDDEQALNCYRTAAWIGAPATALAHYRAGEALERLADIPAAVGEYVLAVHAEPGGVTVLPRLVDCARQLNNEALAAWAADLLAASDSAVENGKRSS